MRLAVFILIMITLFGCDSEDAFDCVKKTGEVRDYNIEVADFTTVDIHDNVHVTIEQGPTQQVILTTGENLRSDISFEVIEQELIIKDGNKCNWARGYGNLNVKIVTPTLFKITSSGGGVISSKGTLDFPNSLDLISRFYTADFDISVDIINLKIVYNDLSNFKLSGFATNLEIFAQAGDGRVDARGLALENGFIAHRGTNDIYINAHESLKVELRSTGNVIYCTIPNTLEVLEVDDRGSLIQSCD